MKLNRLQGLATITLLCVLVVLTVAQSATISTTITQRWDTFGTISSSTMKRGQLAIATDRGNVLFAQITGAGNSGRVRYYPGVARSYEPYSTASATKWDPRGAAYYVQSSLSDHAGLTTTAHGGVVAHTAFGTYSTHRYSETSAVFAQVGANTTGKLNAATFTGYTSTRRLPTIVFAGYTGAYLRKTGGVIKPATNSTTVFQVQPAASTTPVINIDTTNNRVGILTQTPSTYLNLELPSTGNTLSHGITLSRGTGYFTLGNAISADNSIIPNFIGKSNYTSMAYGMIFSGIAGSDSDTANGVITFSARNAANTAGPAVTQRAFDFRSYTASLMTILGSGYVGIGTASPTDKLHVTGGNVLTENTASTTARTGAAYAISLTAGEALYRGEVVYNDPNADMAVLRAPASNDMPLGVVIDDACLQSSACKIAIAGLAYTQVTAVTTRGYVAYVSATITGTADTASSVAGANHNAEIGHSMQTTQAQQTFDGSSASVVSVTGNTITTGTAHGWTTGTPITYRAGGGTSIAGLTDRRTYYCTSACTGSTVALASTIGGAAIDITAVGTGSTHTLTQPPLVNLHFN